MENKSNNKRGKAVVNYFKSAFSKLNELLKNFYAKARALPITKQKLSMGIKKIGTLIVPLLLLAILIWPFISEYIGITALPIPIETQETEIAIETPEPIVEVAPNNIEKELEVQTEMDPEKLQLYLGVIITVAMQVYKISRKQSGKPLSTKQVNYILIGICLVVAFFWGDAIGIDFPTIDLKDFSSLTKDLDGTLLQLLEAGGSLFGPAVILYWILKPTVFKLLPQLSG